MKMPSGMRRIFFLLLVPLLNVGLLAQTPTPSSTPTPAPSPDQTETILRSIRDHKEEWVGEVQLKSAKPFVVKNGDGSVGQITVNPGVQVKVLEISANELLLKFGDASARVLAADTDLAARWAERQKQQLSARPTPSLATPSPSSSPSPSAMPSAAATPAAPAGAIWVNGYWRKNGTYVSGHWRKR